MDGFLAPTSRPASAMSQSSYEEDMPLPGTPSRPLPTILVNTPGDEENFVAALSAGYNYKKRGRHLSGAR
jgi:hypothetical protein